jgi:Ion channel
MRAVSAVSSLIGMWIMIGGLIVIAIFDYTYIYRIFGLKDTLTGNITNDGPTALYFTIVTWTTLGYGDVLPVNQWTRAVAAGEALTGYFIMAMLIAALVAQFDALARPAQAE